MPIVNTKRDDCKACLGITGALGMVKTITINTRVGKVNIGSKLSDQRRHQDGVTKDVDQSLFL